jgi:hypothetical protein
MISHSWDDYPDANMQLAYWLDPEARKPGYLNGYDPYREFWLSGDTLSNIRYGESLTTEAGNLGWGSYSGHNAEYLTGFAEEFNLPAGKKMLGVILHVADNFVASPSGRLILTLWDGDNLPDQVRYEKEVSLANLAFNQENFIEFDSVISTGRSFFAGYRLQYDSPQDTFSVYMAQNRFPEQYNTAYVSDGYQWQSLEDFTGGMIRSSFAIMPVVYDSIPESTEVPHTDDYVIAYPNPASSYIWLEFRESSASPVEISLYNAEGQQVMYWEYGPWQRLIRIDQFDLASGIYFFRIKQGNVIQNLKVAILK